ncbi:hypothetical protein IQ250_07640 [Pseudanabaenaceae cyanobacterium LEGE 13415]|nr:hypothetical protein [Pseudanabaenaceae cyanobacterium LEGE 13415]
MSTGIVVGTATGIYYFWRQLTQLPEWYNTGQNQPRTYAQIQKSSAAVEKKIEAQIQASPQAAKVNTASNQPSPKVSSPSDDVQVALSSQELNDLLVTKITEKRNGQPLPSAVKGFNAAVKEDKLKTGAVIDIQELQNSGLAEQQQQFLSEITQKIPMNDRKVYIGVEGRPRIQNGQLRFDENARIQVGNMSFTIAEVASRLGVSPEKVQDQLNLELRVRGLTVRDIDFKDGNAILKGDPK